MFFDRIRYTATQVSDTVFNVTLDPNYEALPEAATRASLYVKDTAGNQAHIDGYRVAGQIVVNFIHNSTETDDTMPTFGAGLEIYGITGAQILNNMLGRGLVFQMGQSNGQGVEPSSVGPKDWTEGRILQLDASGNPILGADPLVHAVDPPAGSVGMMMTFAKDLLRNEFHNQIVLAGHCEGSTGFFEGQWVQGGPLYNGMLAKIDKHLAEHPNNYLICGIWTLGEDDSWSAERVALFEASLDLATANVRADITGNYRQPNANRLPIIITQMSPDWNINPNVAIGKAIVQDFPNRVAYTGYVDSTGATSYDDGLFGIHFDSNGQRLMGSRMYDAYIAAKGNTTAVGPGDTLALDSGSYTLTGSDVTFIVDTPATIVLASGSYTLTGSDVGLLTDNQIVIESGSYALTGSDVELKNGYTLALDSGSYTLTGSDVEFVEGAPVTVEAEFLRGVGQTTGGTLRWANQGTLGSSHDAVQATASEQPTFDASGNVVFDGSNDRLDLPIDLANDSAGISVMVRFRLNASNTGVFLGSSSGRSLAFYASSGKLTAFSGSSPILSGATTMSSGTWYKAYYTVNAANDQEVWLNEVSDGSTTGGTWSIAPTFLNIGVYNNSSVPMDGDISDIAIQRGVMSLADMNELTADWGT